MAWSEKAHAEAIARLRSGPGVPFRESGQPISFASEGQEAVITAKYRLDSPDEGERMRGLKRFKQSHDFKRHSPYRRRFY